MTTVTDSLFAQATTMAQSSFISQDELRSLPSMSRAQLDALGYGAVKVDDAGVIELYNRYEAELANIQPADAEGKSFFTQVAPCTNNNLFFGACRNPFSSAPGRNVPPPGPWLSVSIIGVFGLAYQYHSKRKRSMP